jgi:hypothetical protein
VLYADSSDLSIQNLHIEHVDIRGEYPRMMFLSGGQYLVRGMKVDGQIVAENVAPNTPSFSTLVRAANKARVTLSGVRTVPFPPDGDLEQTPGFIPLKGRAVLVDGNDATFYLLDRPLMPVYTQSERATFTPPPDHPDWSYEALWTWKDASIPTTAQVRAPMAKAKEALKFSAIAAGSTQEQTVNVDEAREGDLVTLGPPANLPTGLMASGLVETDGEVVVRLYNATGASVTPPSGTWTVAVGGGPQAGFPQETSDLALLVPPYDARPEPDYD